jgi:nitrate/nitrite-specific signal transduction histidine kinase
MLSTFRRRLGLKLFASHLVVIVVGVVVLASAAEVTAPSVFEHHMDEMMASTDLIDTTLDIDFRSAIREALVVAAGAACVAAIVVSIFVTRQVVMPIQAMMRASQRIAAGQYEERVEVRGNLARDELDELARLALSFNQMAAQLERTEKMRRR